MGGVVEEVKTVVWKSNATIIDSEGHWPILFELLVSKGRISVRIWKYYYTLWFWLK